MYCTVIGRIVDVNLDNKTKDGKPNPLLMLYSGGEVIKISGIKGNPADIGKEATLYIEYAQRSYEGRPYTICRALPDT